MPSFILKSETDPASLQYYTNHQSTPESCKIGGMRMLFHYSRKGNIATNYRSVSLPSITCKILEHIVHSSIMKHFDKNNIMTNSQHRFCKRISCESQLIFTMHDIATRMTKCSQVDITLLDLAKILDKVPHKRLLCNLNHYGVNNKTNRWIGSFLENRKQCVILEGAASSNIPVASGVLQDTLRGLLLSLSYIHVMPEATTSSETRYSRMTAYLPHNQQPDRQRLTTE